MPLSSPTESYHRPLSPTRQVAVRTFRPEDGEQRPHSPPRLPTRRAIEDSDDARNVLRSSAHRQQVQRSDDIAASRQRTLLDAMRANRSTLLEGEALASGFEDRVATLQRLHRVEKPGTPSSPRGRTGPRDCKTPQSKELVVSS